MSELFLSFLIILIAFFGFAIGLIFKNQPIKGSCGGMANIENSSTYDICGRTDPQNCKDLVNFKWLKVIAMQNF